MSVTAKCLIDARFAQSAATTEYITPVLTHTIIDKFTATNTDAATQTISINLVPTGGSVTTSNRVISSFSIVAGGFYEIFEMHNHVLNSGDFVAILASVASKIVIRMSGREVT